MSLPKFVALLSLVSLSFIHSAFAEGVKFQLKFESGKNYHSETTINQTAQLMMAGQQIKTQAVMKTTTVQKANAVEEGTEVKQSMSELQINMNAGGMQMAFDSKNPEGPLAAMFEPLLKAKTTTLFSPEGQILKVDAPALPGMENMGMGKQELEQAAREVADMMPNRVVEVGKSWQSESKIPLGGILEKPVEIHYELNFEGLVEREGHKVAKVNIEGTIKAGDENIEVTSKELAGVMYFDPELGQPREMSMTMNLEIGLPQDVEVAEGAGGKMPITMKTNSRLIKIKQQEKPQPKVEPTLAPVGP